MTQSPSATPEELRKAVDPQSEYRQSIVNLNQLIRQGASLSGQERNCAFLNTQGRGFASIAAVSGFDFVDDARSIATVDWDADGDLDVWVSNRTSPRVRFLRNQLVSSSQADTKALSLLLKGSTCNRDAIGATAIVYAIDAERPQTATVRAGEGFLSQSSKWLHFGLGAASDKRSVGERIERVEIHWPDGKKEVHDNLIAGRYEIIQGRTPKMLASREVSAFAEAVHLMKPAADRKGVRVALTSPIACPSLRYKTSGNEEIDLVGRGRPTLITLWSSSCPTCVQELEDLAKASSVFATSDVEVVLVSIDDFISNSNSISADAKSEGAKSTSVAFDLPYESGDATPELVERLTTIHGLPFDIEVDVPVPLSFLIDRDDHVAVMYRGPVAAQQIVADVEAIRLGRQSWQSAALPLGGRWNKVPAKSVKRLAVARDLLDRGQTDDALDFIENHADALSADAEFPKVRAWLGDELFARGRAVDGINQYRLAFDAVPNDLTIANNLAWQLATHPDDSIRDGKLATQIAEAAAHATQQRDVNILSTLAAAYAENGEFDKAVNTMSKLVRLSSDASPVRKQTLQQRREMFERKQPLRQ